MSPLLQLLILAGIVFIIALLCFKKMQYTDKGGVEILLHSIKQKINNMGQELNDLTTEVRDTKGIMQSAMVLIEGFSDRLEEAGTDKSKLTILKNDLKDGKDQLAKAIADNPLPSDEVPAETGEVENPVSDKIKVPEVGHTDIPQKREEVTKGYTKPVKFDNNSQ